MYLSLIDTVSKIVDTYGVDIISDSRFWHILSDTYSFGNEYALKKIFKSCLTTGYISKIVSIKGNSKKTNAEITHIIESENKLNPGRESEYAAVLYSVAIAIGSCNKTDYSNFINRNNPRHSPAPSQTSNSTPQQSPNTTPNNQPESFLSFSKRILSDHARIILLGLISLGVSTILYGLYIFCGWWLFFVLPLIGLIQVASCGYMLRYVDNVTYKSAQEERASVIFPFIVAYLVNTLISIFFRWEKFRLSAYHYFGDWQPSTVEGQSNLTWNQISHLTPHTLDRPSMLSFLLAFPIMGIFIGVAYGFLKVPQKPKIKAKYAYISLMLLLITESCIFVYPKIKHKIQESNYNVICKQLALQEAQNDALISSRQSEIKELSFKGIKLGTSWETALAYAQTIVELENSSHSDLNKVDDGYFYSFLRNGNEIMEMLTEARSSITPTDNENKNWFTGKLLKFKTSLDNQDIDVKIFGLDNEVYAIAITPFRTFPNHTFENYIDLVELYTTKYGEPERITDISDHDEINYSDTVIYGWTFKNGVVRLSRGYIVYVPASFFTLATDMENKKRLEQEEAERRIRYYQFQQDSIKKAKQLSDSLRKVRNHKNAINEI